MINISHIRNIANLGRGSSMTQALHQCCDELEKVYNSNDIQCPFCHESDFDLAGLKWHILNNCSYFEAVEVIQ